MDWVKLSTSYYDDDAIEALDDAAEVMFTRGLARAGELEREGFIPEKSLAKLTRRRRYATLVEELVRSGLWTSVPGGVQVTNWDRWQDRLDDLARRRAADRDRQRKRRLRLRDQEQSTVSRDHGDLSRDVTHPEGEGEQEGVKGGSTSLSPEPGQPPPRRCTKHTNHPDPPNCGACRDARLTLERWEHDQAAEQQQRRHEALAAARASPRCGVCGTRHQIGACPIAQREGP